MSNTAGDMADSERARERIRTDSDETESNMASAAAARDVERGWILIIFCVAPPNRWVTFNQSACVRGEDRHDCEGVPVWPTISSKFESSR